MRLLVRKVLTSLLVFLTLVFSFIFISYAWFDNNFYLNSDALGRARIGYTSYFAGGTGIDTDPFIIAEPEHLSNLAYLQNLGKFNNVSSPYFFKVAHPTTGDRIDIDFSTYGAIPPIGDHIYPFVGVFDGNYSNLQYLTIDGIGKQDIGVFGFISGFSGNDLNGVPLYGEPMYDESGNPIFDEEDMLVYQYEAVVTNLFIEEPIIVSNPTPSEVTSYFHEHNDHIINRATGYIIGHLGLGSILENVFVIAPTINSLLNADMNRTQYGLIGYNEADRGVIAGGPRTNYKFTLDFSAYAALVYAYQTYGNWYVINEAAEPTQITLSQALIYDTSNPQKHTIRIVGDSQKVNTNYNYSLSTMKIWNPAVPGYDTKAEAVYLYDKLLEDNYIIGTQDSQYSRENIDVVGNIVFDYATQKYQLFAPASQVQFTVPLVNSVFIPTNYNASMLLYVKPTNLDSNLGSITAVHDAGDKIGFYSGYTIDGLYSPSELATKNLFPSSGEAAEMKKSDAFTAIEVDPDTDEMIVFDPSNGGVPDYYVFLVAVTQAQVNFTKIDFAYEPQALVKSNLTAVQKVDFVDSVENTLFFLNNNSYEFSFLNFGYNIISEQQIEVTTIKEGGIYEFYIDYETPNGTVIYFDIINIEKVNVKVYYKDNGNYVQIYPILAGDPLNDYLIEITLQVDSFGAKIISIKKEN